MFPRADRPAYSLPFQGATNEEQERYIEARWLERVPYAGIGGENHG
jgi:hypothetical protein